MKVSQSTPQLLSSKTTYKPSYKLSSKMRAIWSKQRLVFFIAAILLFQAASGIPLGHTNAVTYVPTGEKGKKPATNSSNGLPLIPQPPVQDYALTNGGVKELKPQADGPNKRMERSRRNVDVEKKVKEIVVQQLDVQLKDITMDSNFIENLGADSLGMVELIMAIEQAFECDISDEEAEKIHTVQDLVNRAHVCVG